MCNKNILKAIGIIAALLLAGVPAANAMNATETIIGYGWNFVGIPQNSDPITPADFINSLEGIVVMWSADNNLMFDPAMPDSINTLKIINPGETFWIYSSYPASQNKVLPVSKTLEQAQITLHQGKNYFVTPWYMEEIPSREFVKNLHGVNSIWLYSPERGYLLYDPAMPEFLDGFLSIKQGTAYLITMDSPDDQIINLEVNNPEIVVPQPEVNKTVPIVFDVSVSEQSGMVDVLVNITSILEEPIASIVFDLNFNRSVLNLTAVENGNLNNGWVAPRFNADGKVLMFYRGNGTELSGNFSSTVATLKFQIEDPEMGSSINISSMQIGNVASDFGSVTVGTNGTFRG